MSDSTSTRILIIANDEEAASLLAHRLREDEDCAILTANDMQAGLRKAQTEWPSLIFLELRDRAEMFDLCRALKSDRGTQSIPIIIRASAHEATDRIAGLEAGADDYVGEKCHPREIILRIKAVLRRGKRSPAQEQLVRGPISVDAARCQVAIHDRQVRLTAVEFKLLRTLLKQAGQIQSREALQSEALGNGQRLDSRTIDTHIRRLRRKLGRAAYLIETVRGSGYRLRPA